VNVLAPANWGLDAGLIAQTVGPDRLLWVGAIEGVGVTFATSGIELLEGSGRTCVPTKKTDESRVAKFNLKPICSHHCFDQGLEVLTQQRAMSKFVQDASLAPPSGVSRHHLTVGVDINRPLRAWPLAPSMSCTSQDSARSKRIRCWHPVTGHLPACRRPTRPSNGRVDGHGQRVIDVRVREETGAAGINRPSVRAKIGAWVGVVGAWYAARPVDPSRPQVCRGTTFQHSGNHDPGASCSSRV